MSTFARQLLHRDAPVAVREIREAFEQHEPALKEQAERMAAAQAGPRPAQLEVPFLFDDLQVLAVYDCGERVFSKLIAHAPAEHRAARPSFSIAIYLTS